MKLPFNEGIVRWAVESNLEELFLQSIDEEIDRRQAILGKRTREEFFAALSIDPASARGYWTRGVVAEQPGQPRKIKDPKSLVKFLRLLKPTIEIDARTEPWDRWRAGSKVIVLVGVRHVSIPKVSKVNQRAVGARDSQAFAELSKILYKDLGLDCEVVLQHVPANLPKGDSSVLLEELLTKSPDVGMVCVLGSPVVNPLANPAAREVFRGAGKKTPYCLPRFRWAHKASSDNFLADCDLPERKEKWSPAEEGIAFPNGPNAPTQFQRVGDDLVFKQMASDRSGSKIFQDAGIFMMDCSLPTILVLCAGHGGCGTLGCVRQLKEMERIGDLLDASRTSAKEPGGTKPDQIVAVVQVNRRRKISPPYSSSKNSGSAEAGKITKLAVEAAVDDLEIVSSQMVWASVQVPGHNW